MGCAHNKNQNGFTLVEISIVMIIVGLLIGGTFGGMKLIENMQVNKAVQDLKAFDAGGLTFRDIYGRLPGDLRNPSSRLPNCSAPPCSTSGNGDRKIGGDFDNANITVTDEAFVYWQHLLAADLISGIKNVADLTYGEGQPENPITGGFMLMGMISGPFWFTSVSSKHAIITTEQGGVMASSTDVDIIPCEPVRSIDRKIDDGRPGTGRVLSWGYCITSPASVNSDWSAPGSGPFIGSLAYTLAY